MGARIFAPPPANATNRSAAQKLAWRIRVTHSTHLDEVIATRMTEDQSGVSVVRKTNWRVEAGCIRTSTKHERGKSAMKL